MSSYSDFANAASDILLKKGEAQARAKERSGEIWGGTIANLGQVIPQQVQEVLKQRAAQRKTQQINQIFQDSGGDLEKAIPQVMGIDQELGAKLLKQHAEIKRDALEWQKLDWERKKYENELDDRMLGTVNDEDSYARYVIAQKEAGRDISKFPPQYDPAWVKQQKIARLSFKDQLELDNPTKKLERLETVRDGVAGVEFVEPTPGEFYPSAPKPGELVPVPGPDNKPVYGQKREGQPVYEKSPTEGVGAKVGSFEDFVVRKYGDNPTPDQVIAARKAYGQADDRPAVTVNMANDDVEAIADAIIRGDQPPELTGLYRNAGPVRAALARKGYDQSTALTDWRATQKHVATLNGAQQTRMAQAIDNAAHSLEVIEDLANQWDGGKFPLLNKAKLAAARQGALGPKAQQIATQLEAQISDVTSELGNVYMGGNSPTDHALSLAAKNLSADWTRDQLKSALSLARKNLQIRQNSMRNVGVAGASSTNPYAAPPPVVAPKFRFNPTTGKVEAIP